MMTLVTESFDFEHPRYDGHLPWKADLNLTLCDNSLLMQPVGREYQGLHFPRSSSSESGQRDRDFFLQFLHSEGTVRKLMIELCRKEDNDSPNKDLMFCIKPNTGYDASTFVTSLISSYVDNFDSQGFNSYGELCVVHYVNCVLIRMVDDCSRFSLIMRR